MQLRYLKPFSLYKRTKTKQTNGAYIDTETLIKTYYCQSQEIRDGVSASIYGASIDRMLRIISIRGELETYLDSKITPSADNVSDYFLNYLNKKYKIVNVREKWVDVELYG